MIDKELQFHVYDTTHQLVATFRNRGNARLSAKQDGRELFVIDTMDYAKPLYVTEQFETFLRIISGRSQHAVR